MYNLDGNKFNLFFLIHIPKPRDNRVKLAVYFCNKLFHPLEIILCVMPVTVSYLIVFLTPFKLNGNHHYYQLDQSIFVLRAVMLDSIFHFIQILIEQPVSKHSGASDLGLHCLHVDYS